MRGGGTEGYSSPEPDPDWDPDWDSDPEPGGAPAEPPLPNVVHAGFWDRSEGSGPGFVAGGVADRLEPGPVLTHLTEEAWLRGLDKLTDDELIGVLRAARRMASRAAAVELAATADLVSRRTSPSAERAARAAEHVDDELAAALTLTRHSAAILHDLAVGLARLRLTKAALAAGRIDQPRAAVIVAETGALSDWDAAVAELAVIRIAPGLTTGQLREEIRRVVLSFDSGAVQRRKAAALQQARVELWSEPAGTAALAGRDLPAAWAVAADKHLSAVAVWLAKQGVEGTQAQLRAQAFLALLSGQPVSTVLSGQSGGPGGAERGRGEPGGAERVGGGPGGAEPGGGGLGGGGGSGGGWPVLAGSVHLTVPLTTWLGLSRSSGRVPGFGPLDADDSVTLAAMLAGHPATRWCLTVTDAAGAPVAHGCTRRGPPADTGRPADTSPSTNTGPPMNTGPPANTSPSRGAHPASPGGPGPPNRPAGNGTETSSKWLRADRRMEARMEWLGRVKLARLPVDPCDHNLASDRYQPSATLRHLLRIRHQTCTHMGCRRPAKQCDLDHSVPYDRGGRTCWCNLGPVCRRHHRAKQAPGWSLAQLTPGRFVWTTPSGRRYRTGPTRYPG